jgi:hypothetical protein
MNGVMLIRLQVWFNAIRSRKNLVILKLPDGDSK